MRRSLTSPFMADPLPPTLISTWVPRRWTRWLVGVVIINGDVGCLDDKPAAVGYGASRVHSQIDQDLLQLPGVHPYQPQASGW